VDKLAGVGDGCVEATPILQTHCIQAVEESQVEDTRDEDTVDIDAVADMAPMLRGPH
jgi:hypothetical protein